ncbi:MAG: Hpt domain-containing protein [Rhodospirillales bacterium]|nr:Hpt domain-containing protein [Rhodospirillales bacterium]
MADTSIIRPPRHISRKVPKSGGPSPEQAIMLALNAAEELTDEYQGWAVDDLRDLWQKFEKLSSDRAVTKAEITEMFDIAHEIRGQGGSFGFDLISAIADSLCKFIEGRRQFNAGVLDVIKVHILAMRAVFHQQLKGDQGALSEQLTELLQALRNKVDLKTNYGS